MPGHVKKSSGPDPDPSQWLFVSYDLKQKLKVTTSSENSDLEIIIVHPYSGQALWPQEVLLGPGKIHRRLQRGNDREHWGGEGHCVRQVSEGGFWSADADHTDFTSHWFIGARRRCTRRTRWARSTPPSSIAARICPTWPISMTPPSSGTWRSDMSTS